jgi:hypothetical protein
VHGTSCLIPASCPRLGEEEGNGTPHFRLGVRVSTLDTHDGQRVGIVCAARLLPRAPFSCVDVGGCRVGGCRVPLLVERPADHPAPLPLGRCPCLPRSSVLLVFLHARSVVLRHRCLQLELPAIGGSASAFTRLSHG